MSTNAKIVAWACFGIGVAFLVIGAAVGLVLGFRKTAQSLTAKDAKAKVDEAKTQVDALKQTAVSSANKSEADSSAADAATTTAATAKDVLSEIGSIVGSLPENLRFAGLLVLIGAALMSVATVQFGGHSLF